MAQFCIVVARLWQCCLQSHHPYTMVVLQENTRPAASSRDSWTRGGVAGASSGPAPPPAADMRGSPPARPTPTAALDDDSEGVDDREDAPPAWVRHPPATGGENPLHPAQLRWFASNLVLFEACTAIDSPASRMGKPQGTSRCR